jgi:hypothetical protein
LKPKEVTVRSGMNKREKKDINDKEKESPVKKGTVNTN